MEQKKSYLRKYSLMSCLNLIFTNIYVINGFTYCTLVFIILFQLHVQLAVIVLKGIIAALDTARKVSSIFPNKFFMQIHLYESP